MIYNFLIVYKINMRLSNILTIAFNRKLILKYYIYGFIIFINCNNRNNDFLENFSMVLGYFSLRGIHPAFGYYLILYHFYVKCLSLYTQCLNLRIQILDLISNTFYL